MQRGDHVMNQGSDPILAFGGSWSQQLGNVLEAMADERPGLEVSPGPAQPEVNLIWWKQSLDASPGAAVWVGTPPETCTALGQRILSAAGVESKNPNELRETYLEVVRQSLGGFASVIGAQLSREVVCTEGCEEEPPPDGTAGCEVALSSAGQTLPRITFLLNKQMLESIAQASRLDEPVEEPDPAQASDESGQELSVRASSTLNLLMDIELPVSVSFGRTRVRIQEILKLITGSIIELDRSISEPVEVIVNNCVVARGEVVVVDGNYGVRISEVMSRRERLQESRRSILPIHRSSLGAQAAN